MLFAQIPLKDGSAIDIRFTSGASQITQSSFVYSLQDIESLTGRNLTIESSQWAEIFEANEAAANYYLSENRQYVSAGKMNVAGAETTSFFAFTLKNDSEHNFSEIFAAFDMLYNKSAFSNTYDLRLMYRINNSEWETLNSAGFSTANLEMGEEPWNSLSIQLNIDDIFLRSGDELDLVWYFDDLNDPDDVIPLMMQRVEVEPKISNQSALDRGSIVITEIMPSFSFDGTTFEYIELYNPTNSPVSLKGIEIRSSMGSHVIQRDLVVDPYQVLVLSNMDISDLPTVRNNYFYTGSVVPGGNGRIEFLFNSTAVASATYNNAEPGVSLQLDRVINAFDGYTSMRNLQPSEQIIYGDILGSPGAFSVTLALYKKTISEPGWHLISLPGFFNERLSRNQNISFYELNGEQIQDDAIRPFEPIFIYKSDSNPFTLFVEEDVSQRQQTSVDNTVRNYPEINLSSVNAQNIRDLNSPLVNIWDIRKNDFSLKFSDDISTDIWTPLFVNSESSESVSNGNRPSNRTYLDRYIPITLNEGSSSQKRQLDIAVLGFMEQSAGRDPVRYDLPKLTSVLPYQDDEGANQLFLSFEDSHFRTNSFTHLPYNPDKSYRVGLGTDLVMQSGNMVIEWSITDQIPEEWKISLEDTQTGTITDMREVNSYRFRSAGKEIEVSNARDRNYTDVSVLSNSEGYRFYITIEPFEEVAEQEETIETPGIVELRPNYPNPFNPSTNISFYLPEERPVRLGIYNIVGQQVALLMDDTIQPGEHSVVWNAMNNPSGIYIVQLETGNRTLTRKITLIK
ncbi:MAG: lamin tail domain-containing protein [Balneolaceae bacterium]|nr:lamin tail domain-containing protein [Balneolaceae bacterium]